MNLNRILSTSRNVKIIGQSRTVKQGRAQQHAQSTLSQLHNILLK